MIRIEDLHKSYGTKDNKVEILKGIDLEIKDGDFVVILGASGSGKSTLLNVISGLEKADHGKVVYGDTDISEMSEEERTNFRKKVVGYIFQQYFLLPNMNVDKNVRMGADLVGNTDYRKIINKVGLGDKLKKYPSELSGGEQQRVSIARALAKKPEVLFLDEPTGALDEETGRIILDYISELQQELNFTVIMVTHNQNIADMAKTIIKMNSGKIVDSYENIRQKTAYEIDW